MYNDELEVHKRAVVICLALSLSDWLKQTIFTLDESRETLDDFPAIVYCIIVVVHYIKKEGSPVA